MAYHAVASPAPLPVQAASPASHVEHALFAGLEVSQSGNVEPTKRRGSPESGQKAPLALQASALTQLPSFVRYVPLALEIGMLSRKTESAIRSEEQDSPSQRFAGAITLASRFVGVASRAHIRDCRFPHQRVLAAIHNVV